MRLNTIIEKFRWKSFEASERFQNWWLGLTAPVDVSKDPNSVTVITMVKNEALRLPYFFSYYESLGVDRFILLDHASTDDTAAIADAHPKTTRIPVKGNFAFKTAWLEAILDKACLDRWAMVLDADEILVWPHMQRLGLHGLVRFLGDNQAEALASPMLDMFPKGDVNEAGYSPGQDPLEVANYFDPDRTTRNRNFGIDPELNKVSLMRWRKELRLAPGHHFLHGANMADIRACILHFKFLQDFRTKPTSNALIGFVDKSYHKELNAYQDRLEQEPVLDLWSPSALKYEGPEQLLELGFMQSSQALQESANTAEAHNQTDQ